MAETPAPASSSTPAAPAASPPASAPAAAPGTARISDADYQKLTPAERYNYARNTPPAGPAPNGQGTQSAPAAAASKPLATIADFAGGEGVSEQQIRDALAFQAADQSRRATLPTPESYTFDLPADLQLPPNINVVLDPNDPVSGPLLNQARQWAHEVGLDQQQFSKLMGIYAASRAGEATALAAAEQAQKDLLGPAIQARTAAVNQFLNAHMGEDAKFFTNFPLIAGQVRGFEKLIQKMNSQGAPPFSQAGRDAAGGGGRGISEAAYNKLSPGQRLDYARDPARFLASNRVED